MLIGLLIYLLLVATTINKRSITMTWKDEKIIFYLSDIGLVGLL